MKRAVKFNSEEERRHILSHFNPKRLGLSGVNHGWILLDGTWSSGWECLEKDGYTELSFEDWCKEFNHPFKVEKEAVHCTTQEEWDYVLSKLVSKHTSSSQFGKNNCINVKDKEDPSNEGWCCSLSYYKSHNYAILTFQQWCDKYSHEGLKPYVAKVGDWVYVLKTGSAKHLKAGDVAQIVEFASYGTPPIAVKKAEPGYYLFSDSFRKATQAEIDSVTKTTEGLGLPIVTSTPKGECSFTVDPVWTADNWYVEVTSQEEANEVIRAADKMYGKGQDKNFYLNDEWKYVGLCKKNKNFSLLSEAFIHDRAKPRPISDFIPAKQEPLWKTEAELIKAAAQQGKLPLSAVYESYRTEKPLVPKECCKTQQDELVIYKPKRLIL
jgi:hypothetical protein